VREGALVEFEGRLYPRKHNCSWTEEEFVAFELRITRQQYRHESEEKLADRMKRSERYLRWRYRGFIAGEIASL